MTAQNNRAEVSDAELAFQRWWGASKYCQVVAPREGWEQIARDGFFAALRARPAAPDGEWVVKPLDDDQIMEIIQEVAPWKSEPQLNDLLTYEKSPPMFPQATYDVPSFRAKALVKAVEKRILSSLSTSHPEPTSAVQVTEEMMERAFEAYVHAGGKKLDPGSKYAHEKQRMRTALEAALSQSQPTPLNPAALGYDQLSVLEPAPQPDAKSSVDHHAYRVAHIPEPTEAGVEEPEVERYRPSCTDASGEIAYGLIDMVPSKYGEWVRLSDHNTIVERLHMVLTARRRRLDRWIADGVDAINRADQAESALTTERERSDRLREALFLLREFVLRNGTQWKLGAGQHHPIWSHVAELLDGSEWNWQALEGPHFKFIQPKNEVPLAALRELKGGK